MLVFSGHTVWVRLHHRGDLLRGHGGEHPDFAPGDPVMAPTLDKPIAHLWWESKIVVVSVIVLVSMLEEIPLGETGAGQGGGSI